jgi:hypothetical protein
MTEQHFQTTISKTGSRVFIAMPFKPGEVWGVKQRHFVTGTINGHPVRGSLSSDGTQSFLLLGAAWRRDTTLGPGDPVNVTLHPEGPQLERLAIDISAALEAAPQAKAFFEGLATFYRNGYVKWIESAKKPETRTTRIQETIRLLAAGQKQK